MLESAPKLASDDSGRLDAGVAKPQRFNRASYSSPSTLLYFLAMSSGITFESLPAVISSLEIMGSRARSANPSSRRKLFT